MEQNKKRFKFISSLAFISSFVLFVAISTAAPVFATDPSVNEDTFFTYEYEGYTYKCYKFLDNEPGVAIAWGQDPADTPNGAEDVLNVPGTVYDDEDNEYTVRAIAKGGFRYCDFNRVKLPTTIEAMYEESFAYCRNLRTFDIPYAVSKIYPSTFIDCRQMETIHYTDDQGRTAFGNSNITEIDDHAFTNCIALRDFYCPKNVVYFGESCFQNCQNIVNFYFPSEIKVNNVTQNHITVRPYAFADCSSLAFIYFETNMKEIDNYAFVDISSSARIYYNGNSTPTYKRLVDGVQVTQSYWRRQKIATNQTGLIPISTKQPTIHSDDNCPSLRYTIEESLVRLDSRETKNGDPSTVVLIGPNGQGVIEKYAAIYKFDTPVVEDNCFNPATGALTIPNTLGGYPVKVIKSSTFSNNTAITSVTFNKDLVQICNKAFYNCLNIASLNFGACEELKEVSYQIFNNGSDSLKNTLVTSLVLPDCLEYIGGYSFSCFYNVKTFSLPANVQAIDDLAFYRLGYNIKNAEVDLLLPKSLNDAAAQAAYFKHFAKGSYKHEDYTRFYAVGKYLFNEANCIRSVEMEDDPAHENDMTYTCSFYSNSFHTATNLIRFKASKNLQFLGKDVFKKTSGLREVFLTTTKSQASGHNFPWCINEEDGSYGGTLFFGASPEVVCYVDGAQAPGILSTYTLTSENDNVQVNTRWNAESYGAYHNETRGFGAEDSNYTNLNRTTVPTYYNVDFANGIKYWDPINKEFLEAAPVSLADYNNGIISFVKNSVTGKYAVARYYYNPSSNTGTDYIDLTDITGISADLTSIGPEAFARSDTLKGDQNTNKKKQQGFYFVLPTTITEIGERAFYRRTEDGASGNGYYGVRIVTYKDSDGKYIDSDGVTQLTKTQLDAKITALEALAADKKRGFCTLSSSVTKIGKDAFYNHIFGTVYISGNLTYFGNGAFFTAQNGGKARATDKTITLASGNTKFSVINDGVYYTGSGNAKKMLIYQTHDVNSSADVDTTLNVSANTKALGLDAINNTLYKKVVLPSGLTTIYGGALAKNTALQTIEGTGDLRYIGSMENATGRSSTWSDDGYTEVFDSTIEDYVSNIDFRDYAYKGRAQTESLYGACIGNGALKTIDFASMSELRKIGASAFESCGAMINMAGTNEYVYKQYNSNNTFTVITGRTSNSQNVLDLSGCSHLRSIGTNAFKGCSQVKYIHLPENPLIDDESSLNIGFDPEAPGFKDAKGQIIEDSKSIKVLVGETAFYAHHDFGKSHNAQIHYHSTCFGKSGNLIYYRVHTAADIPTTDTNSIKYWTIKDGEFILINSAVDARTYFANNNQYGSCDFSLDYCWRNLNGWQHHLVHHLYEKNQRRSFNWKEV